MVKEKYQLTAIYLLSLKCKFTAASYDEVTLKKKKTTMSKNGHICSIKDFKLSTHQ